MKAERFEDLEVWQKGRELVNKVYDLVRDEPFSRDGRLMLHKKKLLNGLLSI